MSLKALDKIEIWLYSLFSGIGFMVSFEAYRIGFVGFALFQLVMVFFVLFLIWKYLEKSAFKKTEVWFWSFMSGVFLVAFGISYELGFAVSIVLHQFVIVLLTSYLAWKYLENA